MQVIGFITQSFQSIVPRGTVTSPWGQSHRFNPAKSGVFDADWEPAYFLTKILRMKKKIQDGKPATGGPGPWRDVPKPGGTLPIGIDGWSLVGGPFCLGFGATVDVREIKMVPRPEARAQGQGKPAARGAGAGAGHAKARRDSVVSGSILSLS